MQHDSPATTFLFTDIEGSTRLWEQEPDRMRPALARHDAIARASVEAHGGEIVKMTGDGLHAVFGDPLDAVRATVELQVAMLESEATLGMPMRIRCGLHAGVSQKRDNDYYGTAVNRAARVMSAAHGGQMLVSHAVAMRIGDRLPAGIALRDLGKVRLRDLADPERLYQVVHPRLRADFPPLRSLEATPNNLPHQLASFVGREREMQLARELLAAHRLVTVVGMGGMGKTRLAVQVAAEVVDQHADGVWLVDLAALRDPERVVQIVASALRVVEEPGRPLRDALLAYVRERSLLIVLDNCEHLIGACAELARALLGAGSNLRLLATSREPLQLTGEATLPLSALPTPGLLVPDDPEALSRFDAVRLFVERAQAVSPGFQLDAANADAVGAICRRLDGIPLALELAGARVRTMPVHQIAARLLDRLRLLASADPTVLPRQRTLQALIDWSHELLIDSERQLLRQLSVFAGGWTVEAAEAVCKDAAGPEESVLELLARLVERSLVAMEPGGERYHLLEIVRQYAQAKLGESGESAALGARHFAFYLAMANEARSGLVGPDQAKWLARLDAELENLLLAHHWAGCVPEGAQPGLALVSGLKFYWINRGLLELGHRVTLEALQRSGGEEAGLQRCRGLFHAAQICYVMGRYAEAQRLLEESLVIAQRLADEKAIAAILQPLGLAAMGNGDREAARSYLSRAVAMARAGTERRELAAALSALALLLRLENAKNEASALYEEAISISHELRDSESETIVRVNRAMISMEAGDLDFARADLGISLALAEALASTRIDQCLLDACGAFAATTGQWERAARLFTASEACARQTGLRREPTDEAFLAPLVARTRQALGSAYEQAAVGESARAELLRGAREWVTPRTLPSPCR